MTKDKERSEEKETRTIPGMRSDLKPQPKEDPDFGPGMEYESGDLNSDFREADEIRKQWKKRSKSQAPSQGAGDKKHKAT